MQVSDVRSGFLGVMAATISSLCCLLPLMLILLGLGSGAFMMTTMQYRAIFIPVGVIGICLGWFLYLRERRCCSTLGCRLAGGKLNLGLLLLATLLVAGAVALDQFPNVTADMLTRVTSRAHDTAPAVGFMTDHSTMGHEGDTK